MIGLVLHQLAYIPEETRLLLGSMACLGATGELSLIGQIVGISPTEVRYRLHPAVSVQLITLGAEEYAFPHESIQEAAAALLDPTARSELHLTAATLLAEITAGVRE